MLYTACNSTVFLQKIFGTAQHWCAVESRLSHPLSRCIAIDNQLGNNINNQVCRKRKIDSTTSALQVSEACLDLKHFASNACLSY